MAKVSGNLATVVDVEMSVGDDTLASVPVRPPNAAGDPNVRGRVYHEEHFNHGVLLAEANDDDSASNYTQKPSNVGLRLRHQNTGGANRNAANGVANGDPLLFQFTGKSLGVGADGGVKQVIPVTGAGPMPKWPAGHQSAAFESIAPKKALVLSPAEIYAEVAHHGHEKSHFAWYKISILSILAGCYVGFSYTTCLFVGGNMSFAPAVVAGHHAPASEVNVGLFKLLYAIFGFPLGFTTIVICGAELYTSMCAYMAAAWWEGTVTILDNVRMLIVTWFCNFIGCALMACLMYSTEIFHHYDYTLLAVARDKVSHSWRATFVKGIFANWLVIIAVFMANAAQDLTGKAVGIFLPISAFVALGFEHCIANQYLFVLAWLQGWDCSFRDALAKNLVPSTIGNWVGGAFFMATCYAFTFGRTPKRIGAWWDESVVPCLPPLVRPRRAAGGDANANTTNSSSIKK